MERLAYSGTGGNLMVYFKDRVGQSSSHASISLSNWYGTCYITPLIGGFVADSYFGRYRTTVLFLFINLLGLILLVLSASTPGVKPEHHEGQQATRLQTLVLYIALYMVALGYGGFRPCILSFGADQFDNNDEIEKKHRSSFFNWNYFCSSTGAVIACTVVVWVQLNVDWKFGFGIPALLIGLTIISFVCGTRFYRYQRSNMNPVTQVCKVIVASLRKYKARVPEDVKFLHETVDVEPSIKGSRKLQHTANLSYVIFLHLVPAFDVFLLIMATCRFFDKAAVVTEVDKLEMLPNPWRLCTVTQVEETKAIIRLLPIWATGITFACMFFQNLNFFVLQGLTMDARIGNSGFKIPAASMTLFNDMTVVFGTIIYDRFIVRIARKFTRKNNGLTQLQRIGVGLFISIIGMLYAGILEHFRLKHYNSEQIPLSIFWQVPLYSILGLAEVFVMIGRSDFFYDQAPDSMRSLLLGLDFSTVALGSFMSTSFVSIVTHVTSSGGRLGWITDDLNQGHLDYCFYLLALLSMVNFGAFLFLSNWYTYKKFDD